MVQGFRQSREHSSLLAQDANCLRKALLMLVLVIQLNQRQLPIPDRNSFSE